MTTQPPDLKKLREVADRATPGPWSFSQADGEWVIRGADNDYIGGLMKGTRKLADTAVFVATFNPRTILALLDAYEASQSALERLETNFRLILSGKPCRDVAECLAEVEAARAAIGDSHE